MKITKLNISKRREISYWLHLSHKNIQIYYNDDYGWWSKREYNQNHSIIRAETSTGKIFNY